jgi:HAD superfamily hydrolase (TIGR01509 family)
VLDRVDHLVNSAEHGVAKPDPRIFEHLCAVLGLAPDRVFFADDSAGHVEGARSAGLVTHRFIDAATLAAALAGLGLDAVGP